MWYGVSLLTSLCCVSLNQKTSPDILEGNRFQLSNFLMQNLIGYFCASKYKDIPGDFGYVMV